MLANVKVEREREREQWLCGEGLDLGSRGLLAQVSRS